MSVNDLSARLAKLQGLRVALVHDWLVSQRGGENVFDAFCEMFPKADAYALIHKPGACAEHIEAAHPRTSWLQRVPGIYKTYPYFLAVMPLAVRTLHLRKYDLVLSSSHCVAKGVGIPKGAKHLSYIHAPMRYIWDRFGEYFNRERSGFVTRAAAGLCRPGLQWWDRHSAGGVDRFVANSHFIAGKVQKYYGRDAAVVHPYCELERFRAAYERRVKIPPSEDAPYLMVTALVPYKRVDLVIEAFRGGKRRLIVVGSGPDEARLRAAAGPEVEFRGGLPNEALVDLYASCRGLIFPGVEDFGIVPLEAMASGMPVIAIGEGGTLETVVDGETGIHFTGDAPVDILRALARFESMRFSPQACRKRAEEFSKERFMSEMIEQIEALV